MNKIPTWADSTCNPVAGCYGCILWPTPSQLRHVVLDFLAKHLPPRLIDHALLIVAKRIPDQMPTSRVYKTRIDFVRELMIALGLPELGAVATAATNVIEAQFRCYAGRFLSRKSTRIPTEFERQHLAPGIVAKTAGAPELTWGIRPHKPWLKFLPRVICISDLGEALAAGIPFEFLQQEIISTVVSNKGQRHVWTWHTQLPERIVEFYQWLRHQHVSWPSNLVPLITAMNQDMASKAQVIHKMDVPFKGLNLAPLIEPIRPNLDVFNWVLVSGETGPGANPFQIEWLRAIIHDCRKKDTALFVDKLGNRPHAYNLALETKDTHGADWDEWPSDLQVRLYPRRFRRGDLTDAVIQWEDWPSRCGDRDKH